MMADFGNGMETKEFCECPTAQETGQFASHGYSLHG